MGNVRIWPDEKVSKLRCVTALAMYCRDWLVHRALPCTLLSVPQSSDVLFLVTSLERARCSTREEDRGCRNLLVLLIVTSAKPVFCMEKGARHILSVHSLSLLA